MWFVAIFSHSLSDEEMAFRWEEILRGGLVEVVYKASGFCHCYHSSFLDLVTLTSSVMGLTVS